MITLKVLVAEMSGPRRQELDRWISNAWVRPDRQAGSYIFRDIDVARVRLIEELCDEMRINEEALPLVLSLLDQLYDQRRRMRELSEAIRQVASDELRQNLVQHLVRSD